MRVKVKKVWLNEIFIFAIILVAFFSYEINIYYNIYEYFNALILLLGCFLFLLNIKNRELKGIFIKLLQTNFLVHILAVLLVLSYFITSLKYGTVTYEGFVRIISVIVTFYIFYLFVPILFLYKVNRKLNFISYLRLLHNT